MFRRFELSETNSQETNRCRAMAPISVFPATN